MKKIQAGQMKQIFAYVVAGGMTTVINYLIFIGLTWVSVNYLVANTLAWLGAVIFAFYVNRNVVFHSGGKAGGEFVRFFGVRFLTLLLENLLLVMMVEWLVLPELPAKIIVSFVTVALNYIACKYSIFSERGVSHE